MQLVNYGLAWLILVQGCSSLMIETNKVSIKAANNKENQKSKKSVETLYSIEDDYNHHNIHNTKKGHLYYPVHRQEVPARQPAPVHASGELAIGNIETAYQDPFGKTSYQYQNDPAQFALQQHNLNTMLAANPLLAALFLSHTLALPPSAAAVGFNHPQHQPINPYVALLLSHYGRYIQPPTNRHQRGIYGYAAANNYHNNKPFGSYKIYEDARK